MQAWQLACVPIACSTIYNVFNLLKPRLAHKQRHPTKCSHASIFLYLFCTQFPIFAPLGHRYQKRDSGKGLWLLGGAYVYSFDRCMLFRTFMTCSFPHRFPCGYCLLAPTVLIARGRKNKHQKTRRLQW